MSYEIDAWARSETGHVRPANEEKVDALIEQALANGGLDNVTAVLMAVR
jgi:serine/threonine protein phosphatase PrpC